MTQWEDYLQDVRSGLHVFLVDIDLLIGHSASLDGFIYSFAGTF